MADTKKLDERQLEARKEILIPINIAGLVKGWKHITYDMPVDLYKGVTKTIDDVAINKRMRNGVAAVATMPVGIMLRNGARAAHNLADGKYARGVSQWLGGTVGAGAAWYGAWSAVTTALTAHVPLLATIGGKVLTMAVAAAVTTPVLIPAFTAGTLVMATAVGLGITALSSVPAVVNLKTGLLRTLDRLRGIKGVNYDGEAEEKAISYDSLRAREERKTYSEVSYKIRGLSDEHKQEIFANLSEQFAAAAPANQNQQVPVAAPVAAPAAKPHP